MNPEASFRIGTRTLGRDEPTYFIADIAANHDGDLERAKALIWMAKEAGADAAKFQHFKAERIASDFGFRALGSQLGHQADWKKPVYDTYRAHELDRSWNEALATTAAAANLDFLTTPYDREAVDAIDALVPAYKVGSGDITWIDFLRFLAARKKPIFLATGACAMEDVRRAVAALIEINPCILIMQCNTNYTGSIENYRFINLNVLKTYAEYFPGMLLGLSDHSPGHAAALGAIALGARAVEKHFTDDNSRTGPDHSFAMNPTTWKEMIGRCRELEAALGDGVKRVEENERETVILQQRCLRVRHSIKAGSAINIGDIDVLRPAPPEAVRPYELASVLGRRLRVDLPAGDALRLSDLEL